mmetsp:Transcript_3702/g.10788  ORF Transcript_3702/g.10788 Transcript_3702/m.10788 type:complete len:208 (+) Transcript_3702:987-1610(+)
MRCCRGADIFAYPLNPNLRPRSWPETCICAAIQTALRQIIKTNIASNIWLLTKPSQHFVTPSFALNPLRLVSHPSVKMPSVVTRLTLGSSDPSPTGSSASVLTFEAACATSTWSRSGDSAACEARASSAHAHRFESRRLCCSCNWSSTSRRCTVKAASSCNFKSTNQSSWSPRGLGAARPRAETPYEVSDFSQVLLAPSMPATMNPR